MAHGLPHDHTRAIDEDDHGDPSRYGIMVHDLLFQYQEDREGDLILLNDAFDPFFSFPVDDNREDRKLITFPFEKFFYKFALLLTLGNLKFSRGKESYINHLEE